MKRFLTTIMMMFFLIQASAWAEFNMKPEDVSGRNGDTLTISLYVSNDGEAKSINAFQLFMAFDKASLTFERVDTSNTLSENMYDVAGTLDPENAGRIKLSGIEFSNPPVIEANSQDNIFLNLIFLVNPDATTDSVLQLTDLKDDFQTATVSTGLFTYIPPPRPVYVLNAIPDVFVDEDAPPTVINLKNCFADPDHTPITSGIVKEIVHNSNSGLVQAVIDGDQLTLTFQKDQFGQAVIEIKATSDGDVITDRFVIDVNAICDGPEIIDNIPDSVALMGDQDTILSLEQYFKDIDNNEPFIPIIANSSDPAIVSAIVNGKTMTLSYSNSQSGMVTIDVIAQSECLQLTQSFQVIVKDPSELPPKFKLTSEMRVLPGQIFTSSLYLENNPEYDEVKGIDFLISDSNNILELVGIDLSTGILNGYQENVNSSLGDIGVVNPSGIIRTYGSGKIMDIHLKVKNEITVQSTQIMIDNAYLGEKTIDDDQQVEIFIKQPPVINNINLSLNEDTTLREDLSKFANDPDNDPLTFSIESQGQKGACMVSSSGIFQYTPFVNHIGSDTIIISVTDSDYAPLTAVLSLSITPVNDLPVVADEIIYTNEMIAFNGLLSYTDVDAIDHHQFKIVSIPRYGDITVNSTTGQYTYQSLNLSADIIDEFTYMVSDSVSNSNTGTISVFISANDGVPTISKIPDQVTNKNISLSIPFTIDDEDTPLENLNLTILPYNENLFENITISGTGSNRIIVIQSAFDQIGEETISIQLTDDKNTLQEDFAVSIRNIEIGFMNEGCIQVAPGETGSISLTLINEEMLVENIKLTLAYNPKVLSAVNLVFNGAFFENEPYTNTYEVNQDEGKIDVSIELDSLVTQGVIGNLIFDADENAAVGQSSPLTILESTINNQLISFSSNPGCFSFTGLTVSGTVHHFNGKSVPNVYVELVGKKVYSTFSDQAGVFSFVGLPKGQYILYFSKNDDLKYRPSAFDVSIIGQITVQLEPPDLMEPPELICYKKIAADVSQNGIILSLDATEVAYYGVGLQSYLNENNEHWSFVTQEINNCDWNDSTPITFQSSKLINLTSDMNISVTAIRLGDVSAHWKSDNAINKTTRKKKRSHLESIETMIHSQLNIPIELYDHTDVAGVDMKILYDPEYLKFDNISIENGVLSDRFNILVNDSIPGQLIVFIYSDQGSSSELGKIVDLTFTTLQQGKTYISLEKLMCNNKDVSGGLKLQESTMKHPVDTLMILIKDELYPIK